MELYMTGTRKLDVFISENIQPNEDFLVEACKTIDILHKFLQRKKAAEPHLGVLKVIKGGSLGKGTALKGNSDADLVVFLDNFKDYKDLAERRPEIIQEMRKRLKEFQENCGEHIAITFEPLQNPNPRALNFRLHSPDLRDSIDFDVLPAFDALGQYKKGSKPDPQRDFIIDRPPKLKSLIRLLKHWYKEYIHRYNPQLQQWESLPPKYALELLAVYAWEKGSREPDFNMAEGFRTVLLLLQQYKELCIFWTTFYDFENETLKSYLHRQLQKPRPIILDPADPTGIVGEGSRWDLLAQEAERCSQQKCCRPHWAVPTVMSICQCDTYYYNITTLEKVVLRRRQQLYPSLSPVSASLPPKELYSTDAQQLDTFIVNDLQPDQKFLRDSSWAIDLICPFLKENCFKDAPPPQPQVAKVVKGGSSGKGTALKGGSSASLVVFFTTFKKYRDQELHRKEIIQEIQRRLEEFKNKEQKNIDVWFEPTKQLNPLILSFKLQSYDLKESIEFTVLPAFDALGQLTGTKPSPQVYIDLIRSSSRGGEFFPCFTELQRDFIRDRPAKLKDLIRLLMHWYNEYVHPWKKLLPEGESLPPKYALELLAVYAWEQGNRKTDFDIAEGFRTVLWLLQQYERLCIFWTTFYDLQNETLKRYLMSQLRKTRPVVLDPADPTRLLGQESRWDLLAQEAEYCLYQKCCTNNYGPSYAHWAVQVQVSWEEKALTIDPRPNQTPGAQKPLESTCSSSSVSSSSETLNKQRTCQSTEKVTHPHREKLSSEQQVQEEQSSCTIL
ncbi:2'-5'-oligoadenylate synthase 3-like [Paroedura picta]|uniref:2'-5'-oligoadenylate synthase 3-like n=1 Tax=Paroedura picta TaxID=143630 RepID=UPI004057B11C